MDIILLFLISLCLLIGQLGRISMGGGVQFYLLEVVVVIHVIWLIYKHHKVLFHTRITNLAKMPLVWVGFLTFGLFITSGGYTIAETLKASLYLIRVIIYIGYAYLLYATHIQHGQWEKWWKIIATGIPVICILQYVLVPDLRFFAQFGWDPHMYRAVGFILDPPIVGSLLGIFLIYALLRSERIILIFNYVAVIFLYSRSTYLAVLFLVIIYLAVKRKWLGILIWVVLFVASVWFAPKTIPSRMNLESAKIERLSTVVSRKTEVLAGIKAWSTSPLWGIGYNRVSSYKAKYPELFGKNINANHASTAFHSFWITQLSTTGIIGIGLLMCAVYRLIKKDKRLFLLLGVPFIVGVLDNVVFHPFVMVALIYTSLALTQDKPHKNY